MFNRSRMCKRSAQLQGAMTTGPSGSTAPIVTPVGTLKRKSATTSVALMAASCFRRRSPPTNPRCWADYRAMCPGRSRWTRVKVNRGLEGTA